MKRVVDELDLDRTVSLLLAREVGLELEIVIESLNKGATICSSRFRKASRPYCWKTRRTKGSEQTRTGS